VVKLTFNRKAKSPRGSHERKNDAEKRETRREVSTNLKVFTRSKKRPSSQVIRVAPREFKTVEHHQAKPTNIQIASKLSF